LRARLLKYLFISIHLFPLALAHHAYCPHFKEHTVRFGRYRVCFGCLTTHPPLLGTLVLLIMLDILLLPGDLPKWVLFFVGLAMVSPKLLTPRRRAVKAVVNVISGAGIGATTYGLYFIPFHWAVRLAILLVLVFLSTHLYYKRFEKHMEICRKRCKFRMDWDNCPGFKDLSRKLDEDLRM